MPHEYVDLEQIASLWDMRLMTPTVGLMLVSACLWELMDGINIFEGVYLVGLGWNEGSVGTALSLMGLVALFMQTFAGDILDKTNMDRRMFLIAACAITAVSTSTIFFVHQGNQDHRMVFAAKAVEGISDSFIVPCIAALTLATFGPHHFDVVMANNILWGHIGSVVSASLMGWVAYVMYPYHKFCFLVITFLSLVAIVFIRYLPEGDPMMGRGFMGKVALDEFGHVENLEEMSVVNGGNEEDETEAPPQAATYKEVLVDQRSFVLCVAGFFFMFANTNVLLVLGELMGGHRKDGSLKRKAIPNIAFAIVLAQFVMAVTTWIGKRLTNRGIGRKPLFMAGLITVPIRCALIIYWQDADAKYLLSTQILDGLGTGFFGLLHPCLVADITFGTGRFNLLMGLTSSVFCFGATLSNFVGQHVAEKYGYEASLVGSLVLSVIAVVVYGLFMPETMGHRVENLEENDDVKNVADGEAGTKYVEMS